jgi:hypothetical protein
LLKKVEYWMLLKIASNAYPLPLAAFTVVVVVAVARLVSRKSVVSQ